MPKRALGHLASPPSAPSPAPLLEVVRRRARERLGIDIDGSLALFFCELTGEERAEAEERTRRAALRVLDAPAASTAAPSRRERPFAGRPRAGAVRLTRSERRALMLAAIGQTNMQIASTLHISHETVKTHLANAFRKLGANDRTHAVVLALAQGLLFADDEEG